MWSWIQNTYFLYWCHSRTNPELHAAVPYSTLQTLMTDKSAMAGLTARVLQVTSPHQIDTLLQKRERRSGETATGGPRLARTPIGTPRQAQPSSTRVEASPAPVPYTAAKTWNPAPVLGGRSEARTGRQLARTPVGSASASAYHPAVLAPHLADPQGTAGELQQAQPHVLQLCWQNDTCCVHEKLGVVSDNCRDLHDQRLVSYVNAWLLLQHIPCMVLNVCFRESVCLSVCV